MPSARRSRRLPTALVVPTAHVEPLHCRRSTRERGGPHCYESRRPDSPIYATVAHHAPADRRAPSSVRKSRGLTLRQFVDRYGVALGVVLALVVALAVVPSNVSSERVASGGAGANGTETDFGVGGVDGSGGVLGGADGGPRQEPRAVPAVPAVRQVARAAARPRRRHRPM